VRVLSLYHTISAFHNVAVNFVQKKLKKKTSIMFVFCEAGIVIITCLHPRAHASRAYPEKTRVRFRLSHPYLHSTEMNNKVRGHAASPRSRLVSPSCRGLAGWMQLPCLFLHPCAYTKACLPLITDRRF
jgi:hypothetical protein